MTLNLKCKGVEVFLGGSTYSKNSSTTELILEKTGSFFSPVFDMDLKAEGIKSHTYTIT